MDTKQILEAWACEHLGDATKQQRDAVTDASDHVLLVAGPGSGKTKTLVWRITAMVAAGFNPEQMVVITFTNAAAKELQARLGQSIRPYYLGTLHGFCMMLLREHGAALGYSKRIAVADTTRAEAIMEAVRKELGVKTPADKLIIMRNRAGISTRPKTPDEIAISTYWNRLKQNSAVDMIGILEQGHAILNCWQVERRQIDALFVDEFQDSATLDVMIYSAIAGAGARTFIVGDPDQAIYSFRGASVEHIMEWSRATRVKVHKLERNFRCPQAMCHAANVLIARNPGRVDKLTVAHRAGGLIEVLQFATGEAEAMGVAALVADTLGAGTTAKDVAVLARTWGVANLVGRALADMGLPVKIPRAPGQNSYQLKCLLDAVDAPDNDFAVLPWVEMTKGNERAQELAMKASRDGVSIAALLGLPDLSRQWGSPLLDALARLGMGKAEIELVKAAMGRLPRPGLSGLTQELAAFSPDSEGPSVTDGITVTTIHGSKGREWPVVYLCGVEAETMPGAYNDREEERRMAFVAITRASLELHVSWAEKRRPMMGKKDLLPRHRSPFIAEAHLA